MPGRRDAARVGGRVDDDHRRGRMRQRARHRRGHPSARGETRAAKRRRRGRLGMRRGDRRGDADPGGRRPEAHDASMRRERDVQRRVRSRRGRR